MVCIRPLNDADYRFVVRLSTLQLALGDDDVVYEGRVLGHKEGPILIHSQFTYDSIMGALYDFNHHRLLNVLVATGHI